MTTGRYLLLFLALTAVAAGTYKRATTKASPGVRSAELVPWPPHVR